MPRLFLVILLGFATLAGGFAHTAPRPDAGWQAVLLAAGEVARICGEDEARAMPRCEACRLMSAAVLPPSGRAVQPVDWQLVGTVQGQREALGLAARRPGMASARAPPRV